jgi:cell cycle serine/threonine-protein kinase CDC5/MSD2
MKKRKLQDEI